MADLQNKITIIRGPVTIAPDKSWTDAAAGWMVCTVSRETRCPDDCPEPPPHVHGTRRRGHEEGVRETPGPVTELHLCCMGCADLPSVYCLSPDVLGYGYTVTGAGIQAGILAHIRRSHPDVVTS